MTGDSHGRNDGRSDDRTPPDARPVRTSRLLLVIASVGLSLLAAEAALRAFHPVEYRRAVPPPPGVDPWKDLLHRPSGIPGLPYEMAPNMERQGQPAAVRTNRHGMRDAEPLPIEDSTCRIAVLGDSYTFGLGVTGEEAYPAVLERLLQARAAPGETFDVLNFGVVGYSTHDELAVLRHKVPPFAPEVVVLGYVLNDPETDPSQELHKHFFRPAWWERFHAVRLVQQAVNDWESRGFTPTGDYIRDLNRHARKWRRSRAAIREFAETAAARGALPLAVIFPMNPPDLWASGWEGYAYRDLHERVRAECEAAGFRVLDSLDFLAGQNPRDVMGANGHPTPLGHRLTAEAIAAELARTPPVRDRLRNPEP